MLMTYTLFNLAIW